MFKASDSVPSRRSHGKFKDFSNTTKEIGKEVREREYVVFNLDKPKER